MELLNREMIDNSSIDPVEDYELYDDCESFLSGKNPTNKELSEIRSYILGSIYNEKRYFLNIIFHYIATLCGFIIDAKQINKVQISNEKWKLYVYRNEIKDSINYYKESRVLSNYMLNDKENISNIIKKSFDNMLDPIKLKIDINIKYDLEYIISNDFLIEYFNSIIRYNSLYKYIPESIKKGLWYE